MENRSISKFNPTNIKKQNIKNNNNILLLFLLTIILILYLYFNYYNIFSITKLPHASNEDDYKLLNKETNSPLIGMEPKTNQNIYEFSDKEKEIIDTDFYIVSDLMSTDNYFYNNPNIKIKDYDCNCMEAEFNETDTGKYINCLEKHKLIKKQTNMINNEYRDINIYTNDKIMNGAEFMNGITGIEDGNYLTFR